MERLRVLVADDNGDCASALASLFDERGYAVREAYDGTRAFKLAQEFRPHVLILDLAMPGMDGYEVAHGIRSLQWARDALIIALSGRGEFQDRLRAQDSGFDYHVVKPTCFTEVLTLVERSNERLHRAAKLLRRCG